MKICLINPPLPERTYPGKAMGLDYLNKQLVDKGYLVEVLDLDVLGIEYLTAFLEDHKPRIVGITNLSIQNDLANEIARRVKAFDKTIYVIKGGFHELCGYEITLKYHNDYVDYVVVGEGEQTFAELVKEIAGRSHLTNRSRIEGLAYFENGHVHFTGRRRALSEEELNSLIPKRLHHHSLYDFDVFDGKKTAQIMSVRGCLNSCNFCTEAITNKSERKRSIESIYSELMQLSEEGYEAIYFDDSTFTRHKDRVEKICELFRQHFPHMVWGCNTRDDCLDDRLISIMERSGCVYIFTGFESAVPEILKGIGKTYHTDYYLSNAKHIYARLKNSSIKSSVFLVFGASKYHGDTKDYEPESFEDVKRSVNFSLNELKPLYLSMNVLRLLPGVPFSSQDKFACMRPDGQLIHAGHYDEAWYKAEGKKDLRTRHHIYRAFEGRGSVVPPYMTPDYCYKILKYVVDTVNYVNNKNHYKCKIIVDKEFEEAYLDYRGGNYFLAPFNEIKEE